MLISSLNTSYMHTHACTQTYTHTLFTHAYTHPKGKKNEKKKYLHIFNRHNIFSKLFWSETKSHLVKQQSPFPTVRHGDWSPILYHKLC